MKRDYFSYLTEVKKHLHDELLPYWRDRGDDPKYGGFITFFDRHGNPTGETEKSGFRHQSLLTGRCAPATFSPTGTSMRVVRLSRFEGAQSGETAGGSARARARGMRAPGRISLLKTR